MNAEFNWWLLIVGLVVGAGLVWLVVADSRRREADLSERERAGEARWIAESMTEAGRPIDDDDVLDVLRLHAAYLAASPPDDASDDAVGASMAFDEPATGPVSRGSDAGSDRGPDPADRAAVAHPIAPEAADPEGGQA